MRPILFLSAAVLAACATPQENPFYQYSSTYGTETDVRAASHETRSLKRQGPAPIRQAAPDSVYSRVETGCWDTRSCAPIAVAEVQPPVVSAPLVSETEQMFDGDSTPGAQAVAGVLADELAGGAPMLSYELEIPETSQQAEADLPRPEVREDTVLTISGPIHQATSGTQTTALMHRVETGDTVYNLAKRYCTDVASVQSLNGLGEDYAISIGQDIKVPSRCE